MSFTARLYDAPAELSPRSRTNLAATLSAQSGHAHHVIIHNLSSTGAMVESYHPLHIGDPIALEISDVGTVSAQVTWNEGALYDCEFNRTLRTDVVRAKISNAKVVWGKFPHALPGGELRPADLVPLVEAAPAPIPAETRLRLRTRALVIVGAATVCWTPVGALLWWLLG